MGEEALQCIQVACIAPQVFRPSNAQWHPARADSDILTIEDLTVVAPFSRKELVH